MDQIQKILKNKYAQPVMLFILIAVIVSLVMFVMKSKETFGSRMALQNQIWSNKTKVDNQNRYLI
jgi:hypothetical protein